jgi:hypothetical protein
MLTPGRNEGKTGSRWEGQVLSLRKHASNACAHDVMGWHNNRESVLHRGPAHRLSFILMESYETSGDATEARRQGLT